MAPIRQLRIGRASTGEAGFTLIELLIVLAIIGLIVAAIPILLQAALPGTRSLAAARSLADDLRAARGAAVASGAATAVRFLPSKQVYLLEPGNRARRLPQNVPFGFAKPVNAAEIVFAPDGTSNGGTVLVGDRATRHRVRVDWLTGRVAVDE